MPSPSLTDHAYALLRNMIVTLELAPGSLVKQDELQTQLGLGRTPIHQALQRLERDEFVNVVPRRGVFVTSVDVMELPVLYESRATLEPYMARMAALRGTDEHWREMRSTLDRHSVDMATEELVAIDRRCHEIIWEAAGNRFLSRTMDMLYAQSDRLWHMHLIGVTDMGQSLEEHRSMLEVFERGDGEGAAALMDEHIRTLHEQIREIIGAGLRSTI